MVVDSCGHGYYSLLLARGNEVPVHGTCTVLYVELFSEPSTIQKPLTLCKGKGKSFGRIIILLLLCVPKRFGRMTKLPTPNQKKFLLTVLKRKIQTWGSWWLLTSIRSYYSTGTTTGYLVP
jgi:hypothetical protein